MKGQVGWYVVRVEDPADSVRIAKEIDAQFANSPAETKSQVESAFAANMMKQFANIQSLILLIGGVVLFTLVLVTGNTMAIAVRERTSELAIFRAIGFSDVAVLRFVIAESLLTALIGSGLGLLLAGVAMPALAKAMRGILPNLFLSPQIVLFGVSVALLVGLVSGFIPGFIATHTRVVNGLRRI